MRRRISASGPADVELAWERYADLGRWADWAPQILGVEATSRQLAPGVTGIVQGPAGLRIPFRVDAVDAAGRTWQWTVTLPWLRVVMEHDLRVDRGETIAGLTVDGPAPIALAYPLTAWVALRRLVA